MQIIWIPSYRSSLDFGDFGDIVLVINAVPQKISKVSKSPFQCIRSAFLLGFFKGCSFAFTILNVTITDVL